MGVTVNSLSFSTVRKYIECPESVFLDKVDHAPRKGISSNLLMGSALHAAAEAHFRGLMLNHRFSPNTLMRVFETRWERAPQEDVIYAGKDKDALFVKARELIELLAETEVPGQILAIERQLRFQLTNDLEIIGKADIIARCNGVLRVIDVKSAAKAYGVDEVHTAASQCFTYAMALPDERVEGSVLLLKKTKQATIENIPIDIESLNYDEWKERFVQVKRAIEHGIRFRNRSFRCKACEYAHLCNAQADENAQPQLERKAA